MNLKNLTSSDEPNKLFHGCVRTLTKFCREWERTALKANKDVRVALIRIGVVLGKDGGALGVHDDPLFPNVCWRSSRYRTTMFSWIHVDDLVNLIYEAITKLSYQGVINGTSRNPVRLGEMCQQLGSVLGRPSWLPVSDFALKALVTEKQEILFSIYEVSNTQDLLIPPSSNILEGMTPPLILSNTIMSLLFSFV
ncbi:hypothetical protein HID58_046649 [Brassica napus]|uniref:Uncharacterized protein n=1 Tax=Brassica napus TaxID=3708 RepID=A0ABQ8AYI8_BRANA|nr:hypothetical protein HID58_046649 [Brassica napus]